MAEDKKPRLKEGEEYEAQTWPCGKRILPHERNWSGRRHAQQCRDCCDYLEEAWP